MKIALYQPWLYLHGGLERSILELVSRSRHEWVIFTGYYDSEGTFSEFRKMKIVELKRLSVQRDIPTVLKVAASLILEKLPLNGFDAFVVWSDGMGDLTAVRNHDLPTFVICSTPLRAVFDPVYERRALQMRNVSGKMSYKLFKIVFKIADKIAWKYFDGVVATSLEVKNRIINGGLYGDCSRMVLYHPGIDWHSYSENVQFDPILLVPGRIMWTKNIELAIDAFNEANLPRPWKLVICGFLDKKSLSYLELLKARAQGNDQIDFVISPDDSVLKDLYRRSSVVLFPPLNEDWGIVPLEGMASSKPVIANARGGPLESIINGETGWLLRPDKRIWAKILNEILPNKDLLIQMGQNARNHVRKYDWSYFVNGVDTAIEKWSKDISLSKIQN